MHCMYFYACYAYPEGVELTLKLVGDGPTDRPTDRRTDIVLHRAAIAAKNKQIFRTPTFIILS